MSSRTLTFIILVGLLLASLSLTSHQKRAIANLNLRGKASMLRVWRSTGLCRQTPMRGSRPRLHYTFLRHELFRARKSDAIFCRNIICRGFGKGQGDRKKWCRRPERSLSLEKEWKIILLWNTFFWQFVAPFIFLSIKRVFFRHCWTLFW